LRICSIERLGADGTAEGVGSGDARNAGAVGAGAGDGTGAIDATKTALASENARIMGFCLSDTKRTSFWFHRIIVYVATRENLYPQRR
jgi:hypothetical protein